MQIAADPLTDPAVIAFMEQHQRELWEVTPNPERSSHALTPDGLRAPGVRVWTAYDDGELVGCAALAPVAGESGHAELKSMRTTGSRRRRGVATQLLEHVLAEARTAGYERISLETGSFAYFEPARRLYARHGFGECGPFGGYDADPNSTFMTRSL